MNKNLLSENMLRFGVKNLSEQQQKELIVKSIMETINQNGLHTEIRKRLSEQYDPVQTAREFVAAGKGIGTNETGMLKAILKLKDAKQFYLFANAVQKITGGSVKDYFNDEMSYADRGMYDKIVGHVKNITVSDKLPQGLDLGDTGYGSINHFIAVMKDSFKQVDKRY